MIRTVIADDEPLVRERIRTLLAGHDDVELVAECEDGSDTVRTILELDPDLAFLDIKMPDLTGLEVVEALPPARRPLVVFITAYDEYAIRGFEVNAVDYLLKPVDPERFDETLTRIRARRRTAGFATRLVARKGSAMIFVPVEEIDWIDARGNYARLHHGSTVDLVREPLRVLAGRLDPERFIRIHRSTIVNLQRIVTVGPHLHGEYIVTLRDGTKLTSSRTRSAELRPLLK